MTDLGTVFSALMRGPRPSRERVDRFLLWADQTMNVFCPTGTGGGVNPHCSPAGGAVHAGSGLPVGHSFTKMTRQGQFSVEVTSTGFKVTDPNGGVNHYSSLSAAAQGVRGNKTAVNGWAFFNQSKLSTATPATLAAPTPPVTSTPSSLGTPPPGFAGRWSSNPPVANPIPATPPPTPAPQVAPPQIHAGSGLTVGATYRKSFGGQTHTVEVTPNGFKVTNASGVSTHYSSLSAAAQGVRGNNASVNGWAFFNISKPASYTPPSRAPRASAPTSQPAGASQQASAPVSTKPSTIPFQAETKWETGKPQTGSLNGVDFAPAPHHFWEHVKDKDIKEPPALKPIQRAGVMIKEPDGRIWIVQPTNQFGSRNHTLPGGGVEKGLTVQQNALKEVWEETGLQVEITGHLGDFKDSNNGNNGRLYIGRRIGGAPWDAKIESHIIDHKTGKPSAESESVMLVTPERAAKLLRRTDDLAQLATVNPIPLNTKTSGQMMDKLVEALGPKAREYDAKQKKAGIFYGPGNGELHAAQELRGFNEKPTVVPKKDFNALMAKGDHIELLRGVKDAGNFKASELADQFRDGPHFPGHGIFGSGTYADSTKGSGNVAASYSGYGSGSVIRMALPKSAKIIKVSELEKAVPTNPAAFKGYQAKGGKASYECWMGVQAALAGYDAIHADGVSSRHYSYGKGFYVILSRSILTVQKEDASGHKIS